MGIPSAERLRELRGAVRQYVSRIGLDPIEEALHSPNIETPLDKVIPPQVKALLEDNDPSKRMVGHLAERPTNLGRIATSVIEHGGSVEVGSVLKETGATPQDVETITHLKGYFELKTDTQGKETLVSPPLIENNGEVIFDGTQKQ